MVLLGFTGFYWVLLGFTRFNSVLLDFTGFYRVFLGFIGIFLLGRGRLTKFNGLFSRVWWRRNRRRLTGPATLLWPFERSRKRGAIVRRWQEKKLKKKTTRRTEKEAEKWMKINGKNSFWRGALFFFVVERTSDSNAPIEKLGNKINKKTQWRPPRKPSTASADPFALQLDWITKNKKERKKRNDAK